MPEIKVVQFPTITRPTEPADRTKPALKSRGVEQSRLQQIFANGGKAQATSQKKLNHVNQIKLSEPVEKAKAAMLKFYQPDKKAAKETAPLGQIIDIKI